MNKINILDVWLDNLSMTELLTKLDKGVVFTPNVDHLMKLQRDEEFRSCYNAADYKVCDSKIVQYASKFLGTPVKEKVSGSDLFPAFCMHHKENENIKIFLLGGAEQEVAVRAKDNINSKVGREIAIAAYCPSFGFEKNHKECLDIVKNVNESGATVLAVGVGAPKQEKWISRYKELLPNVKIFLAIGATIEFEAGCKKRSPKWMSQLGLEWLHRLLSEPKRLWKRYLVDDMPFLWAIAKQKLASMETIRLLLRPLFY